MNKKTIIIAEAGVNHNGSLELAIELVKQAKQSGADYVKFQTFSSDRLASIHAPKAMYQKQTTNGASETQYDMLKRLELTASMHEKIYEECERQGIQFLSTPFDSDSLKYLDKNFAMDYIKLGSGEITNAPLLLDAAKTNKKIILSTGMATLQEIEDALSVIGFGYYSSITELPSKEKFKAVYQKHTVRELLSSKVSLLHCTTEYPTQKSDVNLNAMNTMRNHFNVECGYSDHTEGVDVALFAVAAGAHIIEKHFTLDKSLPGPDHKASLDAEQLKYMVSRIREVEFILGDGVKAPVKSELSNRLVARKGLKATQEIKKNQLFTEQNIMPKRPENGRSPFDYWELLNQKSTQEYTKDDAIS